MNEILKIKEIFKKKNKTKRKSIACTLAAQMVHPGPTILSSA